ncbi:hypothetical protein HU200_011183 [Digitaria exilis]|uniref:CRIB domain-containing protein n=1 Tax=Digitaria exilis TaxID=1010633 RepID=A0A835FGW2_9POAL|nr:hypothetical protein HU200_011183 [Digitaria exilis]
MVHRPLRRSLALAGRSLSTATARPEGGGAVGALALAIRARVCRDLPRPLSPARTRVEAWPRGYRTEPNPNPIRKPLRPLLWHHHFYTYSIPPPRLASLRPPLAGRASASAVHPFVPLLLLLLFVRAGLPRRARADLTRPFRWSKGSPPAAAICSDSLQFKRQFRRSGWVVRRLGKQASAEQPPRRFITIPFASGCRSHSSVDVVDTARHAGKKPHPQVLVVGAGIEFGVVPGGGAPARPPASGKGESLVARLLRGFKNLSQIFAVYDEEEEEEREMVIGLPTDVKHVAHIGWDGSTSTTSSLGSWNRAAPPPPPPPAMASSSSSSSASASTSYAAPAAQYQRQHQQPEEQYPLPLPAVDMRQPPPRAPAAAAPTGATANVEPVELAVVRFCRPPPRSGSGPHVDEQQGGDGRDTRASESAWVAVDLLGSSSQSVRSSVLVVVAVSSELVHAASFACALAIAAVHSNLLCLSDCLSLWSASVVGFGWADRSRARARAPRRLAHASLPSPLARVASTAAGVRWLVALGGRGPRPGGRVHVMGRECARARPLFRGHGASRPVSGDGVPGRSSVVPVALTGPNARPAPRRATAFALLAFGRSPGSRSPAPSSVVVSGEQSTQFFRSPVQRSIPMVPFPSAVLAGFLRPQRETYVYVPPSSSLALRDPATAALNSPSDALLCYVIRSTGARARRSEQATGNGLRCDLREGDASSVLVTRVPVGWRYYYCDPFRLPSAQMLEFTRAWRNDRVHACMAII